MPIRAKGESVYMESNRHLRVATAIIERQGRYLITQRRVAGTLAGLWEFPGGKVETGETDETALERAIRERLGVDAKVGRMRAHRTHHYTGYSVDLVTYETGIPPEQNPRALGVADFRWVAPRELDQYPFPPADQPTTDLLLGIKQDRPDQTRPQQPRLLPE
jgi:8-oxo-dGTP diphosphatase